MFERFTDRARRCLVLSQEESRQLGHHFIGTEHILLGLSAEGEGVAAVALTALGVDAAAIRNQIEARVPANWRQSSVADALAAVGIDLDRVRREVEETFGEGALQFEDKTPFTVKAKGVLESSLSEAIALGHNYIGTEHLLLGLVSNRDGLAAEILQDLGADVNTTREMTLAVMTAAGHFVDKPALLALRWIEDAVRVLPERREEARDILQRLVYPVRGQAFVAIAKDESDDNVRAQLQRITAAIDTAQHELSNAGVGSFVRRARLVLEHPVFPALQLLERAVTVLVAGLQSERFTPEQVSAAAGFRRRSTENINALWQAVWRDRDAADDSVVVGHLLAANSEMAQVLEQLTTVAAKTLLFVEPPDESAATA